MNYKQQIRKLIREEINKVFEFFDFQIDSAEQIETSKALHTLPRKGISDEINNINLIDFEQNQKNKKANGYDENFDDVTVPSLNNGIAPTLTNLYEDATVNKDAQAAMFNLDYSNNPEKNKGEFGEETKKTVKDFNDNINRELNQIAYVANVDNLKPITNIFGISK